MAMASGVEARVPFLDQGVVDLAATCWPHNLKPGAQPAKQTVITDVIDPDAGARVRRHGTCGLNRLWQQFGPPMKPSQGPCTGRRHQPGHLDRPPTHQLDGQAVVPAAL